MTKEEFAQSVILDIWNIVVGDPDNWDEEDLRDRIAGIQSLIIDWSHPND